MAAMTSATLLPTRVSSDDPAARYHRTQLVLGIVGYVLGAAYLGVVLATDAAGAIARMLQAWPWWAQVAAIAAVLGAAHRVLTAPLVWLQSWRHPRRHGLLHQPIGAWLADVAKAGAIATLLGIVATLVVYALLRATAWWWLWGALVFLLGYALLALAAPTLLIPLFYRLSPLQDGDLRARVLRVAARAEVPVLGVWVADQSRKSRTANAAVVGLGRTRRILLFDTLLSELAPDEIETVLAHELGHQVHGDIGRGLLVQAALTLGTFWIADHALRSGTRALGLEGLADPAGLPLFGLVLMAVGLVALPIANGWSRHVERQADDFALRLTGNAPAFIAAMERLAALNLAEAEPHPIKELLFYSHPSFRRRVRSASAFLHQST
jgi:STE24 endopeptidase